MSQPLPNNIDGHASLIGQLFNPGSLLDHASAVGLQYSRLT